MKKNNRSLNLLYGLSSLSLNENAGQLIKALRKSKKVSGEVLAGFLGISQQQVSRYERGETELTLEQIKKISGFFNISIWEFMDILYFFYVKKHNELNEIDKIISQSFYNKRQWWGMD
ncbi:helix-turn-helix domain-containing protein [Morganella morganii]|uniref:helix-turn-helix domain-containing protein n=1 Tax=Morganella morganii TaxID=582 RepID=UPI0034E3B08E